MNALDFINFLSLYFTSEYVNSLLLGNMDSKVFDNISPEELDELREAFRVFDQNDDVMKTKFFN